MLFVKKEKIGVETNNFSLAFIMLHKQYFVNHIVPFFLSRKRISTATRNSMNEGGFTIELTYNFGFDLLSHGSLSTT